MARGSFKKLERVPRPLMAALGKSSSHILCLKDQASNEFFIVDTGSDYSIVKSNSLETANYPSEQFLIAANASKISTHGERTMNLKLSKNCSIKWTFLSTEISFNLIGAEFLEQNNLFVNLHNNILVNAKTKEKIHLTNKNFNSTNHLRTLIPQNHRFKVFNSFQKLAHCGSETAVKTMQTRVIWP